MDNDKYKPYGDLTGLNKCRELLDTVGKATLDRIAWGYLDLLGTSAAIYEIDGSYATALFSSNYCKFMDIASRNLCETPDNSIALNSGKWLCHESCWTNASKVSIDTQRPLDLRPCAGGINIYAVPIKAFGRVIGSINCGYGTPPTDDASVDALSKKYHVEDKLLKDIASEYEHRPDYIITAAKRHIELAAELIGEIYERKKLAREALDKEEQFHAAFDFNTIGMAITSPEKGWIDVNDRLCSMLGYSREELLQKTWIEMTYPDDIEPDTRLFDRVIRGEINGYKLEKRFECKDGSIIHTMLWLNCRRVTDGSIKYLVALLEDITDKKRLEEQNKTILETSIDGFFIMDISGNLKYVNHAYSKITGYPQNELLRMNLRDIEALESPEEIATHIKNIITTGGDKFETRHRHKDGRIIDIDISVNYLRDDNLFFVFARDITHRMQSEAVLNETYRKLSFFVEQTMYGVIEWDLDFKVRYWNSAAEKIFGYSRQEAEGKWGPKLIVPKEIYDKIMPLWYELLKQTSSLYNVNENVTKSGNIITCEWINTPLLNESGKVYSVISIVSDISDRIRMQNELNEINVNLQLRVSEEVEKNKVRDQLMYEQSRHTSMGELLVNISHHWRQPLCGIALAIQDIKDAYLHGELDGAYLDNNIAVALQELQLLSDTIDNFRSSYVQEDKASEFNIADEINRSAALLSGYLRSQNITIEDSLDKTLSLYGFPNKFSQAILNILTNAKDVIEHRKVRQGVIRINLYKDWQNDKTIITLSDNGGGIPDNIIKKIFDLYFTTKSKARGTGMGLYIARTIIEKYFNGTISARNIDDWCELRIEI